MSNEVIMENHVVCLNSSVIQTWTCHFTSYIISADPLIVLNLLSLTCMCVPACLYVHHEHTELSKGIRTPGVTGNCEVPTMSADVQTPLEEEQVFVTGGPSLHYRKC